MHDRPLLHLLVPKWSGTGVNDVFGHNFPPMSLLVLGAHARRAGWDVEVFDLNFERSPLDSPNWQGPRTSLRHRHGSGKPYLAALTVWKSVQADREGWFAVATRDYGLARPREAELLRVGIERLEQYFEKQLKQP